MSLAQQREWARIHLGWSRKTWGRSSPKALAIAQELWLDAQRALDFRAAVVLSALGAKKDDVEKAFPSLRANGRPESVRETRERLERALGRKLRRPGP